MMQWGTADPTGINYSVTSNVVTATLTNIPANTIGYIEFNVKLIKALQGKLRTSLM